MAFGAMIQGYIFSKRISLAPLGTLTLDLTNPDGHAKSFLENSNLSADDIDMLNSLGIVRVIYPDTVDEPAVTENNKTLPAEEEKPTPVETQPVESEDLSDNEENKDDTTNA